MGEGGVYGCFTEEYLEREYREGKMGREGTP